jgi:hypothetical protein
MCRRSLQPPRRNLRSRFPAAGRESALTRGERDAKGRRHTGADGIGRSRPRGRTLRQRARPPCCVGFCWYCWLRAPWRSCRPLQCKVCWLIVVNCG